MLDDVRRAAPEGVQVLGQRHDVPDMLRDADVFVLTSVPEGEGMPGVLIEAAMAGLPTVATRVPGAHDVVVDGVTGFLVDADDEESLRAAVKTLADDAELRRRMGAEARRRSADTFDLDRAVTGWRLALHDAVDAAAIAAATR